jgi:hypothetical protein
MNKNIFNINLVKHIGVEVSGVDFKLHLRFYVSKIFSISTLGNQANFYHLKKLFDIYDMFNEKISITQG